LHINRFWLLINAIKNRTTIDDKIFKEIEKEDRLFPLISPSDWKKKV